MKFALPLASLTSKWRNMANGAQAWNELPDQIQRAGFVSEFRSLLRTQLVPFTMSNCSLHLFLSLFPRIVAVSNAIFIITLF